MLTGDISVRAAAGEFPRGARCGNCGRQATYDRARVQRLSPDGTVGLLLIHAASRAGRLSPGVEPRWVRIRYDDASLHHSMDRLLHAMFDPSPDKITVTLGDETLTLDQELASDISAALLRYVVELERCGKRRRPVWH
jgi:hypothetical protein